MARFTEQARVGHQIHQLDMPPVEYGGYLLEYLMEVGPATTSGFGPAVISWQELQAWEHMTGVILTSWEAITLRKLSGYYVAQYMKSQDPLCPPPYVPENIPVEDVNAKAIRLFASMKKRKRAA